VQQSLTLAATASKIAMFAMLLQLRDVPSSGAPTSDLTQIIFMPASTVIPGIPLEPAARIPFPPDVTGQIQTNLTAEDMENTRSL